MGGAAVPFKNVLFASPGALLDAPICADLCGHVVITSARILTLDNDSGSWPPGHGLPTCRRTR